MENQHRKIKGYRELTKDEVALMNEGKALAENVKCFIEKLEADTHTDKRCVEVAKTNLQTGFHWVTHSIAQPNSF
tara:strand:- start:26134 stop:26358 length:225 start_codon:yes stop_codon:yes gene_type:complete